MTPRAAAAWLAALGTTVLALAGCVEAAFGLAIAAPVPYLVARDLIRTRRTRIREADLNRLLGGRP